jgi:tetratricopeptide (TPR) repeat protein
MTGPSAAFLGGQVAFEAEDYDAAEKLFLSIRSTYPDASSLGYSLAQVQYRTHRFSECQKTLLDLTNSGHETSDIYNLLGWCYEKQDRIRDAVRAFDQAIDLDPLKESNYVDLGTILAASNLFPIAVAVANKAVERMPRSYQAHMLKGLIESRQGYHKQAISSYSRAVDLNPMAPAADCELARELSKAGMIQEALAAFEKGIKRFPHDALHYQEYGLLLLELADSGQAKESRGISMLEQAIALNNSLAEPHYQLGNLALRAGRTEEGLRHLKQAVALDPETSKIHYALWRAYRNLGNQDEAVRELSVYERLKSEEDKRAARPLEIQAKPD